MYDDIINLDRPLSKHKKMSMEERAFQFAPFAALSGYSDEIKETGRLTDDFIELSEEEIDELNHQINLLKKDSKIKMTYFIPDKNKDGGKYQTGIYKIKKIDIDNYYLILDNNVKIKFIYIIKIVIL